MSTLHVIARRVGLEAIDYKQVLIDKYGCSDSALGEVRTVNGLLNVSGSVHLSAKNLTKLPFKFGKVDGSFICNNNELTSLDGAPYGVGDTFDCSDNKLTSLKGAPKKVGHNFYCDCNKLTSLEGGPDRVALNFVASHNVLTSLKGLSKYIGKDLYLNGNDLQPILMKPKSVKGAIRYD